jgi:ATP-dependent helicase/nuclease subunit B
MDGVQFILGRAGTGKTRWCIDAICKALQEAGNNPLILLVPEQATYQAERAILSHPAIRGFSRLRILSFNRLQFWLDSGNTAGNEISRIGKQIILQKLLADLAKRLSLYRGTNQRSGLAAELAQLFTEFQQADCSPEQVQALADALKMKKGRAMTAAKWADIAGLYQAYLDFFQANGRQFTNPDIRLREAGRKVAQAGFVRNAIVWVDGFSGFSVQERELLIELLKASQSAFIALCLDPATMDLSNTDAAKLNPFSVFGETEETYTNLLRIFKSLKFSCQAPVILDKPQRFKAAPPLAFVEHHLFELPAVGNETGAKHIRIAACGNVRTETVWVARTIRTLARERRMRYRDIAVVVPEMNTYAHYIESAFAECDIPFFLDRPRNMKNHPVAAMLGAALQAVQTGFALPDVLSFLKSGLAGIEPEALDRLENYCRAFDVQYGEWVRQTPWDFAPTEEKGRYDEKQLDGLRRRAIAPLVNLRSNLGEDKEITAGQFTQAVWGLLEELNVRQTLAEWAADDVTDQVYGHRQLFGKLIELLDEMGAIFGEQKTAAHVWRAIVSDAVESLTVKLIPPTLDQVIVGSIERSRHPDIKAVFLVGATQKQFPVPPGGEHLLAEQDYKLAAENDMELTNPYQSRLVNRQYLTYIAMTRASKYLFISHPVLDEKGAGVVPWSGIDQLAAAFGDLEPVYPQALSAVPEAIAAEGELAQWLCAAMGKDRGVSEQASVNSQQIAAGILNAMERCEDGSLKKIARHVNYALAYDNAAVLDAKLTKAVFKSPLQTSVSRLNTFAACPYQHFARYVLRLEKRKLLRFEPLDIGIFYHRVLENLFNALHAKKKDWAEVAESELMKLCGQAVEHIRQTDAHIANFIRRSEHNRYIIAAAEQTLADLMPTLAALSAASVFKQREAELQFGPKHTMQLSIKRGQEPFLEFSGQIDRLDTAVLDGQPAGVVFDFKRTSRTANFAKILYGLDLQLPVYLLAIKEQDTTPVGAFYLPIEGGIDTKSLSQLGQEGAKLNKAKGLFDGRFAGSLDTTTASGWNRYYNFFTGKDGDPCGNYNSSGALKPDDFAALLNYTVECVCRLAADLSGGKIDITPYRLGKTSPCSWCDYRALCRFDWQINDYNILESCDKEEALEKMKENS